MKTASWISALTLGLFVLPGVAAADGGMYIPPFKIQGKFQCRISIQLGNANADLAPWYLYFPAGAGQQALGPTMHFPNWPPQPMAPVGYAPQQFAPQGPQLQRVGYHYPAAPSYWYGE